MTLDAATSGRTRGSILLPVIVVLLLIAAAATAMTLQARTSLREAAIRRDRLQLGFMADGMVRAVARVLSTAIATQKAPPFLLDGTAQACAVGGNRWVLTVQDEGGLVNLNSGRRELILLVLQRAGVSGWNAKAMTDAIMARRDGEGSSGSARSTGQQPAGPFASVDQIDRLPGMSAALFDRLQPVFTVSGDASTIDPAVAGPAVRAIMPAKELAGPTMARLAAPSSHDAFTVSATILSLQGTRIARRAKLRLDPSTTAEQFITWDAPISFEPLSPPAAEDRFCRDAARLLGPA